MLSVRSGPDLGKLFGVIYADICVIDAKKFYRMCPGSNVI